MPHAFDEYNTAGIAFDFDHPLSPFHERMAVSALPAGARITGACFVRREWLPCPIRVQAVLEDGTETTIYLRMERHIAGVETEARLLPSLKRLGLPVPILLVGPAVDGDYPDLGAVTVISALAGENLSDRGWTASPDEMKLVCDLGIEGIVHLHRATAALLADRSADALVRKTLRSELQGVADRGGPWLDDPFFADSLHALLPIVSEAQVPLVFSNGDYNPANFLAIGDQLTGIIDFAKACFEDPLIGFAKYEIYNFAPWLSAGFVERFVDARGFTRADFMLRLAVRCLFTLQREMPGGIREGHEGQTRYRDRLYGLIRSARTLVE